MNAVTNKILTDNFAFSSSVSGDVWHSGKDAKAYEWWYFDALSDDGQEAVVIVFLDNFIYSSSYNREFAQANRSSTTSADVHRSRSPAVAFTYFQNGRARYRTVLQFPEDAFDASTDTAEVRIGNCSFKYQTAAYGSGYLVELDAPLPGDRRLTATFEWLSVEADYFPDDACITPNSHCWNMVAPRSDVSGKITVFDRKGKEVDSTQFRGTGYHDHKLDNRWLAKTVRDWHWGRAHFADATAVFYRYREIDDETATTKLIVSRGSHLTQQTAAFEEGRLVRHKFGIRYPTHIGMVADDNVRLEVRPLKVISSSFFYLRFLSEMTLTLGDDLQRRTIGISEFLKPTMLNHRWLTRLGELRTGKNGKHPLLP